MSTYSMSHTTARDRLNQLFDALQVIQAKISLLRQAGESYDSELHEEWNNAYELFREAYELWNETSPNHHTVMTGP